MILRKVLHSVRKALRVTNSGEVISKEIEFDENGEFMTRDVESGTITCVSHPFRQGSVPMFKMRHQSSKRDTKWKL